MDHRFASPFLPHSYRHTHMNNLWSISRNLSSLHISPPPLIITLSSSSSKPQNLRFLNNNKIRSLPARDRVIDFGKYKGKMLGTLPSTYLKWVSKNLRARDFEEWAQLADQVLEDPVYKDRIEWEFAQKVLNGDVLRSSSRSGQAEEESPVDELAEISERFGWDNEDKVGWAKVDFGLLGTSGGGRLPRLSSSGPSRNLTRGSDPTFQPKMAGTVSRQSHSGPRPIKDDPKRNVGEKRRERMERVKLRRNKSLEEEEDMGSSQEGKFGNSLENVNKAVEKKVSSSINRSSFPGRDGLLEKVIRRNNKSS